MKFLKTKLNDDASKKQNINHMNVNNKIKKCQSK